MTNYTNYNAYPSYDEKRRQRREEWERAAKVCPHCKEKGIITPINQKFDEWSQAKPKRNCGLDACRAASYRQQKQERLEDARTAARTNALKYCDKYLDREQKDAVMEMVDMLIVSDKQGGHKVALDVIKVIEQKRCKHDHISDLINFATTDHQRAQAHQQRLVEEHRRRVAELEESIKQYRTFEYDINQRAIDQLYHQPADADVSEEPEQGDPDHAQVLATLKKAGLMSIAEAQQSGEWDEEDDTELEGDGYDEEEE